MKTGLMHPLFQDLSTSSHASLDGLKICNHRRYHPGALHLIRRTPFASASPLPMTTLAAWMSVDDMVIFNLLSSVVICRTEP